MTIIFLAVPLALLFSCSAVIAFLWSVRSGQLDDLDTPPLRALRDEDLNPSGVSPDQVSSSSSVPISSATRTGLVK